MSRAALKVPAGDLAAVEIGMEVLIMPRAVAQKLLPLMEKALLADRGYSGKLRDDAYVVRRPVQPQYAALAPGQVSAAPAEQDQ